VERLPAASSADYGTPFYEIFKRYDNQFYKIDRLLFSPAEVTINNLATGRIARAGRLNADVLLGSLGLGTSEGSRKTPPMDPHRGGGKPPPGVEHHGREAGE
jgi:hypothetical protein